MLFQFSPAIQAGLAAGKYVQVLTSSGAPLSIARDATTGQFVGHAVGLLSNSGLPLNPLAVPLQLANAGTQMYQIHQMHQGFTTVQAGLQTLQASVGVLQATTAVIGVGVAAGVALSAVNLWQTLKLREDVKQLKLEVKDGFVDLRKALKDQGSEILLKIEQIAQDIKFEQHRQILIRAYGRFLEATKLIKAAMSCIDIAIRNADLANARQMLGEALADYGNPHVLSETSAPGQLRRLECAWAIEQTIAVTYQLQNESAAASDRLSHLRKRVCQDTLAVVEACESEEELDFIFPEITRIHDHDLVALESWQNHIDWERSLPESERKLLQSSNSLELESTADFNTATSVMEIVPEQTLYEDLKDKSHLSSLRDQLELLIKPNLRQEYAAYIDKQAIAAGHKALTSANLQEASNLTIANLYWYFKVRDDSEEELED
ncbi:hypothetical protein NDA01_10825 [Trichocoleus desertorum AS-A10]|uniref:hypothetical protein n=1 Tax=Trichocoleus desertorum TaxID=1481672 RepID=UPI003297548A